VHGSTALTHARALLHCIASVAEHVGHANVVRFEDGAARAYALLAAMHAAGA
jgi:hypothetical protein